MNKHISALRLALPLLGFGLAASLSMLQAQGNKPPTDDDSAPGGVKFLQQGQPPAMVHPTVDVMRQYHANKASVHNGGATKNLYYHGGVGGVGVETAPGVFLVLWGSQWSSDPSGEEAILEDFFKHVGGSSWLNSVTQYCQGVASGTTNCNGLGTPAGNQGGILAGVWYDNASSAPAHPTQSQLANEAVKAAAHFGMTASGSNSTVQYVIATAHGNNASGFGTQYCAWHSSTSSSYGYIAYTNLPYITDAGASCGANFNNLGQNAGITIVEGHEMAESITDQYPNGGWLDTTGEENGDKCAWISSGQGASANVTLSNSSPAVVYPVQSLWSNAFNNGSGGCVLSY
jgi:serine protease